MQESDVSGLFSSPSAPSLTDRATHLIHYGAVCIFNVGARGEKSAKSVAPFFPVRKCSNIYGDQWRTGNKKTALARKGGVRARTIFDEEQALLIAPVLVNVNFQAMNNYNPIHKKTLINHQSQPLHNTNVSYRHTVIHVYLFILLLLIFHTVLSFSLVCWC